MLSFIIMRRILQTSLSLQSVHQSQVPCIPWYPGQNRWWKECLCCTKYSQGSSSVGIWWCSLWKVNKFWIFPPQEYTNAYTMCDFNRKSSMMELFFLEVWNDLFRPFYSLRYSSKLRSVKGKLTKSVITKKLSYNLLW